MSGALQGIRILDLSRVLAGPYCTMILGDLGAEIIKVEAPGGSDDTRNWGPPNTKGGESAYYLTANRNKRGMTLNLKTEAGKEVLKKLVKQSDVVIENFRNGTMERWGLGYEQLKVMNPRIIYCSITGFGRTGPYKDLPGYDFIIQAMAGLMSITGSEKSGPIKVGVPISDVLSGLYAAIGILAALNERHISGEGQNIDISLFDSQISALVNVASNYLVSGKIPKRMGNEHPNIVPYQTFPTKDGEMVVAVGNDRQFRKLCELLNIPDISLDKKFATNPMRIQHRQELISIISEEMKKKTSKEWLRSLNEIGVPAGPINDLSELFSEEQVIEREMVQEIDHPTSSSVHLVGSPLKLSRTPVKIKRHPPLIGEHTNEILQELGFEQEEIDNFREQQII